MIEASAGTGKTFTIVLLYLRLLLGIGEHKKKLLIHEILVVTFTNAAKEELYIRIKKGIEKLYLACLEKKSSDPIFKILLKKINDINEAIYILKKAKNDINNCSIYTIHSFCQHILQVHTFSFNNILKDEIIENEDHLYLQATQDFWRCYLYKLPENIINIIYQDYKNPDDLLKKIKPFFHIKSINFKNKYYNNQKLIDFHEKNIKKINSFKEKWLTYHHEITKNINSLKINKKVYSQFNLSKWIKDITTWAKSQTQDYNIPISLKYFTIKNIKKNTVNYISLENVIFKESEKILQYNFTLKNIIIIYAIKKINKFLLKEKKKKSLLGFNDLLNILLKTIKKEKYLKNLIRKKYPAVFIDEFQDTDMQQYKFFNLVYKNNKKIVLFLIGDPKQAIYSFRGADIFSYLYAKSKIKKHYYLDTNWRTSINLCKSINFLFSQNKYPFIFENIPYLPIVPSCKNLKMKFTINGISQIPIRFFLQKKHEVHIEDYQIWIGKQCANEISYWLTCSKTGTAKITTKYQEKILSANDIAVLVRNKKEADIIKKELEDRNIISTYSSDRNSVFKTFDAQELLWILESILEPDNENSLRKAISTHVLKKLFSSFKKKIVNDNQYLIIEKLFEYHQIWEKTGIYHLIQNIILDYQKNSNITEININYIKNLNFLHIAELLEEKFNFFYEKKLLIHWFQKKILEKKEPSYNEHIRFFNQSQSVKIITIHKSKGLEYPIVWIPFSIDFNKKLSPVYHDKKNFKTIFDIEESNKSLKIAKEERLSEDIRFLYVAITRSILHCSIGIACLIKKRIKNRDHSDIHHSGLGYTIQNGKSMNYESLLDQLKKISLNNLIEVKHNSHHFILPIKKKTIYLLHEPIAFKPCNRDIWNIISFTQLNKENQLLQDNHKKIFIDNLLIKNKKIYNTNLTINNFPRGKKTGLMIHYILKNLHVLNKKDKNWFSNILEKYSIPKKWITILVSWIKTIINIPINHKKITLSKIEEKSCVKELEFFLPIKKTLYSKQLNQIIQKIDPISMMSPKLFFNPKKGILKGSIDLIFFWEKKYYIIDYKSNWLGENNSFYSYERIKEELVKKRYDLQYQIYTVAVHKYLEKKIKNYNYKNHFGGIFYMFLRAIDNKEKNKGIFYTLPEYSLIKKIITLFS